MKRDKRFFVIVNPVAGHGRCDKLFGGVRRELARRGLEFDFHHTNEPLEAADVANMVIEEGFTDIVAMGGDGTINEVVNGIVNTDSDLPLAVIPAGSGNDFARMNGVPLDPVAAVEVLENGQETLIDLGHVVGDRYFVNGLGIGLDAQVAREVMMGTRSPGAGAYFLAAIRQTLRFNAFPLTLTHASWERSFACISLGITNGRYVGGGFQMAPEARVDDGLLDVCVVEDMAKLKRMVSLPKARRGRHVSLPQVTYRQLEGIEVSSSEKLVAHIDGEPYRLPNQSFHVAVRPQQLRLVVPKQQS